MTRTETRTPSFYNSAKHLRQPQRTRVIDGRRVTMRGWYAWFRTSYLREVRALKLAKGECLESETLPQFLMRHGMLGRNTAA